MSRRQKTLFIFLLEIHNIAKPPNFKAKYSFVSFGMQILWRMFCSFHAHTSAIMFFFSPSFFFVFNPFLAGSKWFGSKSELSFRTASETAGDRQAAAASVWTAKKYEGSTWGTPLPPESQWAWKTNECFHGATDSPLGKATGATNEYSGI